MGDKVVQDDDDTEGTGYWSVMESAERHISAPTIAAAQFLRVASGNRSQRLKVSEKLNLPKPQRIQLKHEEEGNVIEDLRMGLFCCPGIILSRLGVDCTRLKSSRLEHRSGYLHSDMASWLHYSKRSHRRYAGIDICKRVRTGSSTHIYELEAYPGDC